VGMGAGVIVVGNGGGGRNATRTPMLRHGLRTLVGYVASAPSPVETRYPEGPVQGPIGGPPYRPAHQVAQKVGGATGGGPQEPKEAEGTVDVYHVSPS